MKKEKYSPMMEKYLELKKDYMDAIVMYRLGDFYEMFFDDAKIASKALNLTLTGKNAGVKERVPMCGVPYHAASQYIEGLVHQGHKVVIVEQLSDPKKKGLVERGVVQIVTPGTLMDFHLQSSNNFIGSLGIFDFSYVLAYCDLSTGEFYCMTLGKNERTLRNKIESLGFKELVVNDDYENDSMLISYYDNDTLRDHYKKLFKDIHDIKQIKVASNLLNYLIDTQKRELDHIQTLVEIKQEDYMYLDTSTKNALELLKNSQQEKYGTLLWVLDKTSTAMGGRMLKQWIENPLLDKDKIHDRLNCVEIFVNDLFRREDIKNVLNEIYDIEKLASRVAFGNVNARDLKWIEVSLYRIPELKRLLLETHNPILIPLANQFKDLTHITSLIHNSIVEEPPLSIREGQIIKPGYSQELDELRDIKDNGQQWMRDFESKERERTGIKGLKIGYNRVFGYYIEVTKSYLPLVKDEFHYTRKQSLTNAERFITPELKDMEDKILSAQDRILALEYTLFKSIRESIKKDIDILQDIGKAVARLDCFISLAIVASDYNYVRPEFNDEHILSIVDGRHPVVERVMDGKRFIENDIYMDNESFILLITGPNMGGKSTYMRQITLMSIMSQIGSFIPARKANMPIFDQIFTRIGASDDLVSGQSTFMVEMVEANNALTYATKDSLIIFDEIGRGTATFDGMALAQGMLEYIAKEKHCMTLFSTHYHELTYMTQLGIKNVHASADVTKDHITFLYKIKDGSTSQSYGINVAKLAHLPDEVIQRAQMILQSLENNNHTTQTISQEVKIIEKESRVEKALAQIDPMSLSPLDALSTLIELKKL